MPSLFDIGKSGLQAYRQSLAVTGQNIANINTDGYKKREASLEEVTGAGGGVTEISDQTGLGVRVENIKRAFDEFLIDKVRQTSSLYEKTDTFLQEVKDLENLLLPSEANLSNSIGEFFGSLQQIAAAPDDQAPRVIAIEKGKDLAGQFNLYADRIDGLKEKIFDKSKNAVISVNLFSEQISRINAKLLASGGAGDSSNALLDQRDLLIDQLSQVCQISVNYINKGAAEIRLGNTGSGPVIVEADSSPSKGSNTTIPVNVIEQGPRLQPVVGSGNVATNQVQGGIIAGLVDAYALADDTLKEIDNLASILSQEFNQINMIGLNLDGNKGEQMFSVSSLEAVENPTNRSNVGVAIFVTDPSKITSDDYNVIYDQKNDIWTLTSESLKTTVTGTQLIETEGFKLSFFGNALDGDEFSIVPTSASKGMNFLLSRPQDFAAASATLISSSSSNLGTAKLDEVALINKENKTQLLNINSVLSNGLNPVTATEFSKDGGALIIPTGMSSVNMSSYKTQPEIQFGLSSSDVTAATSFTVTLADSTSLTVDLTGVTTIEEIADVLNRSSDVSGNAHNFRSLGLFASGGGSTLTIASNNQNFSTGAVSAGTVINGNVSNPSITDASQIQIFTREGRHLAGTVLSTSEIAEFLTEENGFNSQVEYRADYLNGTDSEKYRNIDIERSTTNGNYLISYGANGAAASAQRAATTVPASHVNAAYTLTVNSTSTGKSENITVPIESSAGYVAGLINTNATTLGVEASAITRVKFPPPKKNGDISFTLKSKPGINNSAPISASVLSTNLTNLANTINNYSGRTGVTANLSSDKKHIILENKDGEDIDLSNFSGPDTLTTNTTALGASAGTTITHNSHGLSTGDKIIYTAGGTALNNLTSGQTYYAIKVNDNSFRLASSASNASGGTALTVGGAGGSATDKFTPPFSLEVLKNDFTSFSSPISIDIDGNSYKAVKLSGELQIESSSAVSTSNDGGSTTVTGSQNSFRDGFYNIKDSSTGEVKTLTPVVLDGDFSASHPNGLTSSSSILSFGLSLPATGTGTSFSTTLNASGFDNLSTAEVSKKLAEGLRTNSPSIEVLGKSLTNVPDDGSSFKINHDGLTYTLTMENGEVIVSGGEKDLLTAYFEDADPITVNTTSLNGAQTITSTEHGLETGDAVTYNAAEKVTVDTTQFNSTITITANDHGFSTADPIVYKAGGSIPISGLTDGTTYFAIRVDANNFKLATTGGNASGGTALTITGGTGGSVSDTFSSPRAGLTDGQTYFAIKVDDHNFKIASTYSLATNSSPSPLTIGTGNIGGNSADTFDPGKNLYISAGKTISASQFSFPVDSTNDTNALKFGMEPSQVETTITGSEITTPSGSDSTHFHITIDENTAPIGVFVRSNSKTINTSGVGGSSTTLTSTNHGFKTGDKIKYTAGGTALNGLTNGTSYYAKVIDANTFSLASSFVNATESPETLLSFGGGNGHTGDTFATVYANAYLNDDFTTPASSVGISAEINQVDDTKAQISIIKEADKNNITINTVSFGDGASAENFGFKTNQMRLNVIGDDIKVQSFSTDYNASSAVSIDIPSNSTKSLIGNNLSISNLPPEEDLIILMTGNGSRKVAANYGEILSNPTESEYKLVIDSTNNKKVEILDATTNHSIATRLIPDDGIITAVGKSLRFTGEASLNDTFNISNNNKGIGDNRNILKMIDLQESDVNGLNSGSFQDIFNTTAAQIGSEVRSGQLAVEDAEASRDEAKSLEDERAGVSLDEEAAALIQFQQAFSANARIIQTARELFESLMVVVSK
ncbi:MAG: flagellar hook-associated protein FlgK [Rickettsiales bacterium]|nr:flagellar hook-associated protein FlgK [Rickettsiales bacterium]RPG12517.1 MAG: flagellar hook-associated protein FlgK [Pelagibacteraceae bacterium TMED195]